MNDKQDNPAFHVYNIHTWSIDFVRLAFLHGCSTGGGTVRGRERNGKPWQITASPDESIGASFYIQGANAVVAWRDLQYQGGVFTYFNRFFWEAMRRKGYNVQRAVNDAIKHLLWWKWIYWWEWRAILKVQIWEGNVKL